MLALTGIAYSAPQPPGSVFKIVTLSAALEAGVAKRSSKYPVQTLATLEGVELENAHGESCGGTLKNAFAHSCNSVFAPMGAKLGAERLVAAAERFGFNKDPAWPARCARRSRPPTRSATTSRSARPRSARARCSRPRSSSPGWPARSRWTACSCGRRCARAATERTRATTPEVARTIGRYMRAVVTSGTGVGAAIPGVKVAGKTGTAELRDTTNDDPDPADPTRAPVDDRTDTDAWFAAYAPARRPRVAVSVLLVGQGAGGETAAPAAKAGARGGAEALDVEVDDRVVAALGALDLELERAVAERLDLHLEEQQRALDRVVRGRRVELGQQLAGRIGRGS